MRIVVVEDDPLAERRLLRLLRRLVPPCVPLGVARDGLEAVVLIERLRPDLLFLDLELPMLSGFDVLGRLAHRPAVVFTSAHTELRQRALALGGAGFLCKPLELESLRRLVDGLRAALPAGPAPDCTASPVMLQPETRDPDQTRGE